MPDYSKVKNNQPKPDNVEQDIEEKPKIEQITTATKKKKGIMRRVAESFAGPDGVPSVASYISKEVIVPMIKDAIVSGISSGISMLVYRDQTPQTPRSVSRYGSQSSYRGTQRTSYNQSYRNQRPIQDDPADRARVSASRFDPLSYIIQDRNEALHVLQNIQDQVAHYGVASLADFYEMIGVEATYSDNAFGWNDNLDNCKVVNVGGGYALNLPRPFQID